MPLVSEIAKIVHSNTKYDELPFFLFDTSFYVALSQHEWWTYFVYEILNKQDYYLLGLDSKVFEEYRAIYEEQRRDAYGNLLATLKPEIIGESSTGLLDMFRVSGWQTRELREKFSRTSKASLHPQPSSVDESLIESVIHRLEKGNKVYVASADKDICETLDEYQNEGYGNLEILSPYTLFPKISRNVPFSVLLTGEAIGDINSSPESPSRAYYLMILRKVPFCGDKCFDLGIKVGKRKHGLEPFPKNEDFYSAPIIKIPKLESKDGDYRERKITNSVSDLLEQNSFVFSDTMLDSEIVLYNAITEGLKRRFSFTRWVRMDLNWLKVLNRSSYDMVMKLVGDYKIRIMD